MKTLRNIISLLSLAAVAGSPVSGVLAPAKAGGCCLLKYVSSSCSWDSGTDATYWEPVVPDDVSGAAGLVEVPALNLRVPLTIEHGPNQEVARLGRLPFYILNQSLLFHDPVSI